MKKLRWRAAAVLATILGAALLIAARPARLGSTCRAARRSSWRRGTPPVARRAPTRWIAPPLALLAGIVVGTYSSVFTATPLAVWFEGRSEHAGRACRPRRSGAEALAGRPSTAGERSDQVARSEHAGRACRPRRSGAEAPAGERSDQVAS